ncbi:MAG: RES family NAD+ phosphorylase [Magnetococcales bacterium]|nr:RES family NAD+ phosphorylase [Magnetococcales bacterium]
MKPPVITIDWDQAIRIIPHRYPPIDIYERIAEPDEWEILMELESLTNNQFRNEIGETCLMMPEKQQLDEEARGVMAPFCHFDPRQAGRFNSTEFGAYYAAIDFDTAFRESLFHMENFYRDTDDPPLYADFRAYAGPIRAALHDLRNGYEILHEADANLDGYSRNQAFTQELYEADSLGLLYNSVRNPGGQCLAILNPTVIPPPEVHTHLRYHWDGQRIDKYFNF